MIKIIKSLDELEPGMRLVDREGNRRAFVEHPTMPDGLYMVETNGYWTKADKSQVKKWFLKKEVEVPE